MSKFLRKFLMWNKRQSERLSEKFWSICHNQRIIVVAYNQTLLHDVIKIVKYLASNK